MDNYSWCNMALYVLVSFKNSATHINWLTTKIRGCDDNEKKNNTKYY